VLSSLFSFIFTCLMLILYAFIAGIKCVISFFPTKRKEFHSSYPKSLQLFLFSSVFFTVSVLVFYYSRYFRLSNKFTYGRVLLPVINVAYYLLFIIFYIVEREKFFKSGPVLFGVILTSLFFQIFIHVLPFVQDLVTKVSGMSFYNKHFKVTTQFIKENESHSKTPFYLEFPAKNGLQKMRMVPWNLFPWIWLAKNFLQSIRLYHVTTLQVISRERPVANLLKIHVNSTYHWLELD